MVLSPRGEREGHRGQIVSLGSHQEKGAGWGWMFPPRHPAAPLNDSSRTPASFQTNFLAFLMVLWPSQHPLHKPPFCLSSDASYHLLSTYEVRALSALSDSYINVPSLVLLAPLPRGGSGHREIETLTQAHTAGKEGKVLFETRAHTCSHVVWVVSVC